MADTTCETPDAASDEPVAPKKPAAKRNVSVKTSGATYALQHVERQVRLYPVQEGELRTMSLLNTISTIMFSIGSMFMSVTLSLWTGLLIESSKSATANIEARSVECICLIAGVIFYAAGTWGVVAKRNEIERIKSESSIP